MAASPAGRHCVPYTGDGLHAPGKLAGPTWWRFEPPKHRPLDLRAGPSLGAERTGHRLLPGDTWLGTCKSRSDGQGSSARASSGWLGGDSSSWTVGGPLTRLVCPCAPVRSQASPTEPLCSRVQRAVWTAARKEPEHRRTLCIGHHLSGDGQDDRLRRTSTAHRRLRAAKAQSGGAMLGHEVAA